MLAASDHCHQVSHGGSQVSGSCKVPGKASTHTHTTHHTHKLRLIETFTTSHKPSMAPVNPKVRSDPNWGRG